MHHGQNGLLFDADDSVSLASQMQRILDEPGLLETLRRNPLSFGSFTAEIEQIEALYRECIENANRRLAAEAEAGAGAADKNGQMALVEFAKHVSYSELSEQAGPTGVVE